MLLEELGELLLQGPAQVVLVQSHCFPLPLLYLSNQLLLGFFKQLVMLKGLCAVGEMG